MKKALNVISAILMVTIFFSVYQVKVNAMDEIENYISKKETAEMIGRAILMEHFPTTIELNTYLKTTEEEETWIVMNVIDVPWEIDSEGRIWLINGGIVGVIFRKSDCQIVKFIVLD